MNTNTIVMISDVDSVDVLTGRACSGGVEFEGGYRLQAWRARGTVGAVLPMPIPSVDDKHKSTRVSVPDCRGRT